ncbi:hypothetical protein [Brevibacterium sp. SMBL_HHYL_HB1]|jgi:hypothetical protein|uniref:hypothetical protein n=1 Tax=Brevibacterium sp. SMBL_HHYL_HB1 TaxID=2777556 RepID=UPI001BA6966A|nr:hypothetical protein [Brevibacterium sp. SMBL_HHYL_HB1]QUL78068.1 hypothetical protein IG171_11305 [Brevibacterium sp. SMBL_HHYL_HB1]
MALIRLTQVVELVAADRISQEPRETLVNTRIIEWAMTHAKDDRIFLKIKTVGESGARTYAAINSLGNNTVREVSAKQVLRDFQTVVQSAEVRQ